MPGRTNYPTPSCPKCSWKTNRVKNTYYSDDNRIIRYRECDDCQWKWWTVQNPESNVDIAKFKVQIPTWRRTHKANKQIKIVPLSHEQANTKNSIN